MMRKWIAVLLALALLAGLTACGGTAERPQETEPTTGGQEAAPPETEVEEPPAEPDGGGETDGQEADTAGGPQIGLQAVVHEAQRTDEDGNLLLQESLLELSVSIEGGGEAEAAVNQALADDFAARQAQAAGSLESARQAQADQAALGLTFYGYAVTDQVDAGRMDGAVISVVRTAVDNTGGAHGNVAARAVNFDTATGRRLTLDDLTGDRDGLAAAVADVVTAAVEAEPDLYYPGAAEQAASLLSEGSWYLDDQGLTVLCDPYLLAPYAAGVLRFTVPYDELGGLLETRWLPEELPDGSGTPTVAAAAELPEADVVAAAAADPEGTEMLVTADGPLRGVRICRVSSADGETWYAGAVLLCLNRLDDGQSVAVTAMLPDVTTNVMVTCQTDDGVRCYGVFDSGRDGSLSLTELNHVIF